MTKVPHAPPADLASRRPVRTIWRTTDVLWQFANAAGAHPMRVGQMRDFGRLRTARFDPHPEPPSTSSNELVAYAAHTLFTAVAERFEHNRELR